MCAGFALGLPAYTFSPSRGVYEEYLQINYVNRINSFRTRAGSISPHAQKEVKMIYLHRSEVHYLLQRYLREEYISAISLFNLL